jgi:pimeloyl-ACP methyl ester carboxylesterase
MMLLGILSWARRRRWMTAHYLVAMAFAQLDGRQLFYLRRGSGTPLLLIQGMAGHHQIWGEPLLDGLAQHFDVISYDHRGVGESTDVAGNFTIADLADDACALLDALGLDSVHVFGISMGGAVAQELTTRHGDRVRALVLGCTWPGGARSVLDAPGPMAMFQAMQTGDLETIVRAGYRANLSSTYVADEPHYPPFRESSLAVRIPATTIMRQAQAAALHDASARLGEISAPTLVLHGTADEMVRYSNAVVLAELIPGATLHPFDDVGHLFWWERPDETIRLVTEHLGR